MLTAQEVQDLQNQQPPTDWAKFDVALGQGYGAIGGPGGLPPGMGPGFDDKLHVHFFMRPQIDVELSTKENRPIFKNIPHVTIMIPGDKNNIPTSIVMDIHKKRFPEHWRQFLAGQAEQLVGTPLHVAPFMTETMVQELAYFKIRTVEQLAGMPDGNMTFMGAHQLKQQAIAYLEKSKGLDAMAEKIANMEKMMEQFKAQADAAEAKALSAIQAREEAIAMVAQEARAKTPEAVATAKK
jgi:hypothetical protein